MPYKDPDARRAYARAHYKTNQRKYILSNNLRRAKLRDYVKHIKSNTPCYDCHHTYPYYVMDFDHLADKEDLIIKFVRNNNRSGLEKEMAKCQIVCSNCHRARTHSRIQDEA